MSIYTKLKQEVYEANLELYQKGLVVYTWGNVSGAIHSEKIFAIKPSGVKYEEMKIEDIVVLDFDGNIIDGKLKPSSDTDTHLAIYKAYPQIMGITHTHSLYATAYAQAGKQIQPYGTTHADHFYGNIPCSRQLLKDEVENKYEYSTGLVILETLKEIINPLDIPGILVNQHGPFTWGKNASEAVYNAVVLEEIAKLSYLSVTLNNNIKPIPQYILDKHFYRKHGNNAYYGQGF